MSRAWDLVVFDWDGTLMDSTAAITRSIQAACREVGVPEPESAQASFVIGLGLVDALRRVAPSLSPDDYERVAQAYRRHYFAQARELVLFDGVARRYCVRCGIVLRQGQEHGRAVRPGELVEITRNAAGTK